MSGHPESTPPFVEVVVAKGPAHPLTYQVAGEPPPVGSRVRVPLGSRGAVGFVVGHRADLPEGVKRAREIAGETDPVPPLMPEIVALTRRVADYYMAPWGQVLAAAVPPMGGKGPVAARRVRVARLTVPPAVAVQLAEQVASKAPRQAEALRLLAAEGEVPTARLPGGVAPRLVERGWVAVDWRTERRTPLSGMSDTDPIADTPPALTTAQKGALTAITGKLGKFAAFLLHGVTGSGKTEIYLHAAEAAAKNGGQALILTPEIALAAHLTVAARRRFGSRVALLHSALSDGERRDEWERARTDNAVDLVIGTRSAVFAPLPRLALIVVDEEHDGAFKQEEAPRYHARDVALMRGQSSGVPVVLGSATPSLESYSRAADGRYTRLILPGRINTRPLPEVEVVDLREVRPELPGGTITRPLLDALTETVARGEQAVLFLNRRGFAPLILCDACGHVFKCGQCEVSLTFHKESRCVVCHYCDGRWPVPDACGSCGNPDLRPVGTGTEGLMHEVATLLPDLRVARMDRDTTRTKNAHLGILKSMASGEIDVLVGTQMIAKGHNLPGVTLVGVVLADQGIHLPDFRAAETTFATLTQVAGRAGRGDRPGRVVLQTWDPEQPAVHHVVGHDFAAFAEGEMAIRKALSFPPEGRAVRLLLRHRAPDKLDAAAAVLADRIARLPVAGVEVLGPAAPPMAVLRGEHRRHVLFKARQVGRVRQAVRWLLGEAEQSPALKGVRIDVDVDPHSLL